MQSIKEKEALLKLSKAGLVLNAAISGYGVITIFARLLEGQSVDQLNWIMAGITLATTAWMYKVSGWR